LLSARLSKRTAIFAPAIKTKRMRTLNFLETVFILFYPLKTFNNCANREGMNKSRSIFDAGKNKPEK
jgi:hypothetical protein